MDRCRFFRHQSFTAANARANRLLAVICRTMGLPFRDRPQTWVKPRKSNVVPPVSGWRVPSACIGRKSTSRGMEREPVPLKMLAQYRQDTLSVDNIVKRHDRIVGESDKGTPPRKARPHF